MPKARTRVIFVAVALLLNFVFLSSVGVKGAYACTCALTSIKDQVERSDAVFSGKVRSIDEGADAVGGGAPGVVEFDVQQSWKGVSAELAKVHGLGDGMDCYPVFDKDETYLVYASREGEDGSVRLQNYECASTKPLKYAKDDLKVLGTLDEDLPDTGGLSLPLLGGAAGVALVLAGGRVTWRGGRRR